MSAAPLGYDRLLIDVTEFSHTIRVEVRIYADNESMRRAATIYMVESAIQSDDLDSPISDVAFPEGTLGVTIMPSVEIDSQTHVVKYGDSPECIIYLSREHLQPYVISHECTHAAMGLYNAEILARDGKAKARKHMTVTNELVAYVQSELLRCIIEKLSGKCVKEHNNALHRD